MLPLLSITLNGEIATRRKYCVSPEACNFVKKETLAQVFSSKFCEISKKTFCYRTLLVAASDLVKADVGLNTLIPQKEMLLLEGVWGGS